MRRIWAIAVVAAVLLGGCVSTKEYKARLQEADTLNSEVRKKDEEVARLNGVIAVMSEDLAKLRQDRDDTVERESALRQEVENLKFAVAASELDLTKEILELRSTTAEKDLNIGRLGDALAVRDREVGALKTQLAELAKLSTTAAEEKKEAVTDLKQTYDDLVLALKEEIQKGRIEVTNLRGRLSLSMVDRILFDSGSAVIRDDGKRVLDRVAAVLKTTTGRQMRIEGHTDNVRIGSRLEDVYPSNWELSTARATTVVRYLQEYGGVDPRLLHASGYGEFHPVASNDTPEGRAHNRRIEIVLLPLDADGSGQDAPAAGKKGR